VPFFLFKRDSFGSALYLTVRGKRGRRRKEKKEMIPWKSPEKRGGGSNYPFSLLVEKKRGRGNLFLMVTKKWERWSFFTFR